MLQERYTNLPRIISIVKERDENESELLKAQKRRETAQTWKAFLRPAASGKESTGGT